MVGINVCLFFGKEWSLWWDVHLVSNICWVPERALEVGFLMHGRESAYQMQNEMKKVSKEQGEGQDEGSGSGCSSCED